MNEQMEQNIQRLTKVFSAEQIAVLLIGVLEGVAESQGDNKESFVNEFIESTINETLTQLEGSN
jgi:hypothetical protein